MRRVHRSVTVPAAAAALVLALAACGGDDAGGPAGIGGPAEIETPAPEDDGDTGAAGEGGAEAPAVGEDAPREDDNEVSTPEDGSEDEPSHDALETEGDAADSGAIVLSEPASFLADQLHPLDLPTPGSATVSVAGEVFEFEIDSCSITRIGSTESLTVTGSGSLPDGSTTFFGIARSVTTPDMADTFVPHESDDVVLGVEQGAGTGNTSSTGHSVKRDLVDAPLVGDGQQIPVVLVQEDGGISVTAIAELVPLVTSRAEGGPTGLAEFAAVCD